MTNIRLIEDENRIRLNVSGHANYSSGDDIVCSACSVLATTLATIISNLDIDADVEVESGLVTISMYKSDATPEIMHYIYFAMEGFNLLAETYPDNVNLLEWGA